LEFHDRIETSLSRALARAMADPAPSRLAAALDYAIKPGGARIRPTILMAVAHACGDDKPAITDAAAAALEFMHCASLVHDDLPCFDDAATRRGKPSVHRAFSQPIAVLAGDALIMQAFETIALTAAEDCMRSAGLVTALARYSGMPHGICAGQGWESENTIDLDAYHRSKTGALFIAATQMGAIAAGHEPEAWFDLGDRIGAAFQIADDLCDATEVERDTGKPSGQDDLHGRPNAVSELGLSGALDRLRDTLSAAIASIPSCPGEAMLAQMVTVQARRITPALKSASSV